ncbi:MAG: hypothetical protein UDB11_09690 [Peptococcaceae bacterium]|nr:hypothetical protein [Peptococcaceae bacterium]
MSTTRKKSTAYWIHIVITLVIMIGFGFLPAPAPITPFGMQMLGIFFGMVYGWSTVDQIWPSLLGLVLLAICDYNTIDDVLIEGWGSSTVFVIVLVLVFSQAISVMQGFPNGSLLRPSTTKSFLVGHGCLQQCLFLRRFSLAL